ncbi:hypothetical protein [Micromonospora maritima]|uniref:Uncharacterized protein n=1 Tax=Micromonospora maritima TaxID=986711 RepID=A0ABW7ZGY3_9ACTN
MTVVDTTTAEHRVLELFGAVCADPDNPAVAAEADAALAEVDRLLALGVAQGPSTPER